MNAALARLLSLVGLVLTGEGLFILMRVVPHESPLLGALLAVAGALMLLLSPPPSIAKLPRLPIAVAGLGLAIGVVAYNLARHSGFAPPEIALVVLGLALAIAVPFAPATAIAWGGLLAGAPLAVWAAQALAKASFAGMTPMELFVRYGLLSPMSVGLALLRIPSTVAGQVIAFPTSQGGLMALNVGVACSGIQAMGLFGGIILTYVAIEKPGWRRGLLWAAIGLFGVYATNVVRLVILALVGREWGSDALEAVHANAGWIFFVAWTGVFAWLTMGRPRGRPLVNLAPQPQRP